MKILVVSCQEDPLYPKGGAGIALRSICEALVRGYDYTIDIVTPNLSLLPSEENLCPGLCIHRPNMAQPVKPTDAAEEFNSVVLRYIQDRKYDLVYSTHWTSIPAALQVKAVLGIPLIHNFPSLGIPKLRVLRQLGTAVDTTLWHRRISLESTAAKEVDGVTVVSKAEKCALATDYGIEDASRILLVINGVDRRLFYESSTLLTPEPERSKTALFVGRLEEEKGIVFLERLAKESPAFLKIMVAGRGSGLSRIAQLSDAKVAYKGFVDSSAALRDLYCNADLLLFPSLYEPFGLVLLESMACGTPPVAFEIGGPSEIITNMQDGILVTPYQFNDFRNAVLMLAKDSSLRSSLSKNAIEKSKLFCWKKTASTLNSMMRRVV